MLKLFLLLTHQNTTSNVKEQPVQPTYQQRICVAVVLLLMILLAVSVSVSAQSITGTVFFDGNNNGTKETLEQGFPNVTVRAYSTGTLISSALTTQDGSYTLSTGIAMGTSYRLEFITPPGYNDGAIGSGSNSSVQFATGGSTYLNLGVYVPNQCGTSGTTTPRILAGCIPFVGDITLASNAYANHSAGRQNCDLTPHQDDLTKYDIGVPYAITVHKGQKLALLTTLSAPATNDFPPAPDGPSAIYAVDYSGTDFTYKSFKLLAKLSNLGIDISNQFPIQAGINNSGEYGLGGITISEDEHYLYLLNMGKGNIVRLDITGMDYPSIPAGGYTTTSQLPLVELAIPADIANCTNGRFRPSALRMYAGKLYIGGICDASGSTDNTGLYAKIIEMNPATGQSRVVFSHDLTTFTTGDLVATGLPQVRWKYPFGQVVSDGNPGEKQPFFNDFAFDDTGSIIFSIIDRRVFTPETNREPGYLVRTWRLADGTFELESDRQSGPFTSAAMISHNNTRQASNLAITNDGPGTISGPKWFFEQGIDLYDSSPGAEYSYLEHVNLANGGIYILPGTKEVVVGFTDPTCAGSSGMRYFDWTTGATKYGINLTNLKYFSISGLSAVCDPAPVEVGNYIWKDSNRDGIQDPGEPPLAGVTVALFENCTGEPIATAITDATGNYYFSSAAGTSTDSRIYGLTLKSDSLYCIRILDLGEGPAIAGLQLTAVSPAPDETQASLNTGSTLSNNDAFVVNDLPTIRFRMGSGGQNNHTYDFGLVDQPCSLTTTVLIGTCDPTSNLFSATVVTTVLNSVESNTLSVSTGGVTQTFATSAGSNATFKAIFSGILSDGQSHTLTASLPNCSTTLVTYQAPVACQSILSLQKFTDRSKAKVGDFITYQLVLTNSGSASATTTVRDSLSTGLTYLAGSVSAPPGTSFMAGNPVSLWTIPVIAAGQSLTLTFQVRVDSTGILYNVATIPGDTAKVCTTIPINMCTGDAFTLTAPTGYNSYRWYKNGVLIPNQSGHVLTVTEPGSYSLSVDHANGVCPDFSCCPVILEEDTIPAYQASIFPATCLGNSPRSDGKLTLSAFNATHTYQYSAGATFNPGASLSGPPQRIPANGVLASALPNPATTQLYTVRVFNSSGCYTDTTVSLTPTVCDCLAEICVPYVIQQIKRPKRIGDPVL